MVAAKENAKTVLVLNGPNLNLLGSREPSIYGHQTLADVQNLCEQRVQALAWQLDFRQSNHEGILIDWLQEAEKKAASYQGIVINPGAFAHTSVALRDAVAGIHLRVIEVHISNVYQRETFRHQSYLSAVAKGVIVGLGVKSYELAIEALSDC